MQDNKYLIPLSIVVAGALVAGAVYMSRGGQAEPVVKAAKAEELAINHLDGSDHILGNPEAAAVLVEYSDTDCPYCRNFHVTLKRLMDTYGKEGSFAWAYRHFPIDQLHPGARAESEALECASSLGGNQKFWEFADALYANPRTQSDQGHPELPVIAKNIGLPEREFASCVTERTFSKEVDKDIEDAVRSGGNGTPHSVIVLSKKMSDEAYGVINGILSDLAAQGITSDVITVSPDKKRVRLGGALPYDMMDQIIGALVK